MPGYAGQASRPRQPPSSAAPETSGAASDVPEATICLFIEIDTARRTIQRGGEPVSVTPREFRVLEYLALHRGRVVSREELMTHLYSDSDETWSNVLDVYVASLRRKLRPDVIQTRRGHGFIVD